MKRGEIHPNCSWCETYLRNKAKRKSKPPPSSDAAAYMRDYRRRKADAGLCSHCGARKPAPDREQCRKCIKAGVESKRISRVKEQVRRLLRK